ncbi:hypothetical protein GCM10010873_24910 [Cypionkella aquatica]|uniref:Lipoprotein n=1 Tax=Cypionkella aquatica TaxID=1756042 RepID=A0AA37TU46_9RHOB|nr:hypothetical protein [Cypionkella aquatica]GLS87517.1 hypothetical protein GCM10010873_24910 [Cypionkella aquatica]
MTFKAFAVLALFALSACAGDNKWATDAQMAAPAAHFVAEAPRTITLFTVQSTRNGSGAHSGLLINASEQVMFDPAGTWYHPYLPERGDVHYGISPRMISYYIDYHARETFNVVEQTVVVSPEVAELIKQRAEAYGSVPKAQCAHSISSILNGVPGFEAISGTWYPNKLMREFGSLPGVTRKVITDTDSDKNHGVLMRQTSDNPQTN